LYPYYASKFCADILSRTYAHTYKLPVAVTRCANIYGPGDFNFSRIVPDTCFSVVKGKDPVIKSDGSAIKDYAFVEDIVDAYFILAKSLINKRIDFGEAFNLGTGKPISVANLVKMIIKVSGDKKLNPEILGKGKNKGKIVKHYFSSAKAKRVLGWQAKYSLKRGLELTYKWYRDHIKH
jgi:CDP-glucose 4,6-dehydratase